MVAVVVVVVVVQQCEAIISGCHSLRVTGTEKKKKKTSLLFKKRDENSQKVSSKSYACFYMLDTIHFCVPYRKKKFALILSLLVEMWTWLVRGVQLVVVTYQVYLKNISGRAAPVGGPRGQGL